MLTIHATPHSVSTLPAEILLMVFWYCDTFDAVTSMHGYLAWIPVLHVCRRWYQLGVGCPMLWQTVCSSRGEDCAREVLSHSRDLPLKIVIPWVNSYTVRAAMVLLHAMPRAKMLRIHIPFSFEETLADITHRIPGPLPLLEHLAIDATGPHPRDACLELPTLFPQELPSLTELRVSAHCDIAKLLPAPALERLVLEGAQPGDDDGRPRIDRTEVLDRVRRMPRLRHLAMAGLGPMFADGDERVDVPDVALCALRTLDLRGPSWAHAWLTDHVSLPVDARVALSFALTWAADPYYAVAHVARMLSKPAPDGRTRAQALRALAVSGADGSLVLEGSSRHGGVLRPAAPLDPGSTADFWLCMSYSAPRGRGAMQPDTLPVFLEKLPLPAVESVNIVGSSAWSVYVPVCIMLEFMGNISVGALLEPTLPQCVEVPPAEGAEDKEEAWWKILPGLRRIWVDKTTA